MTAIPGSPDEKVVHLMLFRMGVVILTMSVLRFQKKRDLENWPRSWMGWEGRFFRRFIEHQASSSLSRKTIRRHVDNLWMLGGEIIRDRNKKPSLRKVPLERPLCDWHDDDSGPLMHHSDSEEQQRSFDSIHHHCR